MATPDIHLLAIENWTKLAENVDFFDGNHDAQLLDELYSLGFHVGSELECRRDGIHARAFVVYTLLKGGTITGFTFSLDGKPIAKGSDYSLVGFGAVHRPRELCVLTQRLAAVQPLVQHRHDSQRNSAISSKEI